MDFTKHQKMNEMKRLFIITLLLTMSAAMLQTWALPTNPPKTAQDEGMGLSKKGKEKSAPPESKTHPILNEQIDGNPEETSNDENGEDQKTDAVRTELPNEEKASFSGNGDNNFTDDNTSSSTDITPVASLNEESDGSNLISYLALILSLATIAYMFYINKKKTDSQNALQARGTNGVSREEMEIMKGNITAMQKDIHNIINRVQSLSNVASQQTPHTTQAHRPSYVENQSQRTTQQVQRSETLYASSVRNGEFLEMGISKHRTEEAVFILVVSGNEGLFTVNDDPQIQQRLLASIKYSVGNAAEVVTKASPAKIIVTVTPGKIRRDGNSWKIINRAIVELR